MCSAPSPDRYPRPHPPRAFVYHGWRLSQRREPSPGATVPGESGRAGAPAFSPRSPRLTSPPFYQSRARFLNLVSNVPAPKFWTLGALTVITAGIGRRRLPAGGTTGRVPTVIGCWLVTVLKQFFPAPLKVIWRTRGSARSRLRCSCGPNGASGARSRAEGVEREAEPSRLSLGDRCSFCQSLRQFWDCRRRQRGRPGGPEN